MKDLGDILATLITGAIIGFIVGLAITRRQKDGELAMQLSEHEADPADVWKPAGYRPPWDRSEN